MATGTRPATRKARHAADDGMRHLMSMLRDVRSQADEIGEHIPDVVDRAREGALETRKTLDKMSEPTLKEVAAGSLGLAAGLFVAGAPRLIVLALATPGVVALTAWATRRPRRRLG